MIKIDQLGFALLRLVPAVGPGGDEGGAERPEPLDRVRPADERGDV